MANAKIRICYVLNNFGLGGAETVALDLARMHTSDLFDVTVLAALEGKQGGISPMHQRFLEAGVKTHVLRQDHFRNPLALGRLFLFLKRGGFDIVLGHNRGSDYWAVKLGRWAGVPHLFWTRHLTYQDMTEAQLRKYRNVAPLTRKVVAVSEAVRQACIHTEGIPEDKVVTIVNGIDLNKFHPLPPGARVAKRREMEFAPEDLVLLFVGRFSEQKAPEAFVDVVKILQEKVPNIRGVMCGRGPLEPILKERVTASGARVEVLGMRSDVPDLLGAADLFVSTSRNEGLPLNVMEAMATGVPFVGPAIPQIKELVAGNPLLESQLTTCPPQEGSVAVEILQAWAAKIQATLDNPDKARMIGQEGREIISKSFSLGKMVQSYEELYAGAMAGRISCS